MFPGQGRPAPDWEAAVREVFAASKYDWTDRNQPNIVVRMIRDAVRSAWSWLMERLGPSAPAIAEALKYLAILIGIALVLWGVWALTRRGGRARSRNTGALAREQLRDATWYREQAGLLAADGRYDEALHLEFLALALDLDDRRLLRFHPAKTPAEYATELADSGHDAGAFRSLVRLLYGYSYAGWPCDRDAFETWRSKADEVRSVARA